MTDDPTWATLAEHAPVGLAATDRGWRVLAVNATMVSVTRREVADLVGHSFARLLTPAGRLVHQAAYAPALESAGRVDELAVDLVRGDGTTVPVLLSSQRHPPGAALDGAWAITAVTPVARRRDQERELRAARRRAESAQRHLVQLHDVAADLAEVDTVADAELRLGSHLRRLGHADPQVWVRGPGDELVSSAGRPAPDAWPPDARVVGTPERPLAVLVPGPREVDALAPPRTADDVGEDAAVLDALVTGAAQALQRIALLDQLRVQAATDPLTGLANRRSFDATLERVLRERRRSPRACALLYLDVDGFKAVNDRLGHAAGDQLLSTLGRDLRGVAREVDTVARVGGDEFALLALDLADPAAVGQLARRLHAAVPDGVEGVPVGISVGAVHLTADRTEVDPDALVRAADDAMYAAKDQPAARGRTVIRSWP